MMKKITLFFLVMGFALVSFHHASAHTFATDGNITVLFHTNPDDDPIVGQPAALLFQISDSTNKFDPTQCNCQVIIRKNNNVLLSSALFSVVGASVYGFTEPYTFQDKAVYQITVVGQPKSGNLFQKFQVEYDLRVDRDPGEAPTVAPEVPKSNPWPIVACGVIFAMIVGVVIYFIRNRRG